MLQPKDTDWLNGYRNKSHIYAIYKKPTTDLKKHIHWKWEDRKIYPMQMESKRKLEEQSSYQTKYTLKKITRDKEGHYIMIKGSIQEEDTGSNTIIVGDSEHPTHTNGQIIKTEN